MSAQAAPAVDDAPGGHPVEPAAAQRDPRWARPALAALLIATATFWTVGLSRNGWANAFYSAAVQAGTKSWKAFLFGSSDAANSITVDKPPASLWPMELAGRVFGVNTWSVQLPQVIAGVACVALVHSIVRKQFGPAAGLIAGLVLALTPVATLMFRYNNPDALLTLLMVVAVWTVLKALDNGRTRWLALCGALIGLGFLTKQLQVMLVVPALGLTYLIAGPVPLRSRLGQSAVAVAAMVLTAGWWVLLITVLPAGDRPYVGGSTDDSFLNLTFGYNGLARLTGSTGFGVPAGPTRLFSGESGAQSSWLLPAALVFLVVGILLCGRASRTNGRRAQYVVWGGWLIGTAAVFSFMSGTFHDYYTVALAPPIAALVGSGAVHLWSRRHTRWVAVVLAATVAATAVWSWVLLGRTPDFVPALRWIVLVGGVGAALVLGAVMLVPRATARRGLTVGVTTVAAATALAGPAAYALQTVTTKHSGGIISAGPSVNGAGPGASAGGLGWQAPTVGAHLKDVLSDDASSYTWIAAITGASDAAGYQLATDDPVMPIGGFIGADPSPTLPQFQRDVAAHRIHFYLDGGRGPMGRPPGPGPSPFGDTPRESGKIADWVKAHFTATAVDGATLYDLTKPTS